ncbi:hypothetical protein CAEBREN_24254 [Caenorhabditis brenneri]|uniref:Uncharacterized protein n=1 Tax=Caenorhabditis brenneri TaxID=135651 RepID=G0NDE0_CAEBE|nr:hypothetical protein CAEBREN_24254 [Caenorhabditis brenneri]
MFFLLMQKCRPRPVPDHTQLELPIKTPEERVQCYEATLKYIYNTDPVARRIGENFSKGYGAAQIVEEEIETVNMSLRTTLALLQNTSSTPGSNLGTAGPRQLPDHTQLDLAERALEERIAYSEGYLEYIHNVDPVTRRIGEKFSKGCGAAQIVEEEIKIGNMSLRATLALLQNTSSTPGSNHGSAGPRQLPDHTQLDLAERTLEERIEYFEGYLKKIYNVDPVTR